MTGRGNAFMVIVACLAATAWSAWAGHTLSRPALIPQTVPAVREAHQLHLEQGIDCVRCHQGISRSTRAEDRNVPQMKACAPCHDAAEDATRKMWSDACGLCHIKALSPGVGFSARGNVPAPGLKFSHGAHRGQTCKSCHGLVAEGAFSGVAMKICYTCHQQEKAAKHACRTCHLVTTDGTLKRGVNSARMIPPEWLSGPTHGVGWNGSHAKMAGRDSAFCANCHRESECQACHTGRIRPKNIHPADWLGTHGTHSSMKSSRCTNCHRSQSFCISCHRRAGVAPDAPTTKRAARPGNFHRGASPAQICRRARTNIAACASCHSESSCTTCHANINPHPVGFSRRCKPLEKRNPHACAKCHQGNAGPLCR